MWRGEQYCTLPQHIYCEPCLKNDEGSVRASEAGTQSIPDPGEQGRHNDVEVGIYTAHEDASRRAERLATGTLRDLPQVDVSNQTQGMVSDQEDEGRGTHLVGTKSALLELLRQGVSEETRLSHKG